MMGVLLQSAFSFCSKPCLKNSEMYDFDHCPGKYRNTIDSYVISRMQEQKAKPATVLQGISLIFHDWTWCRVTV